MQKTAPKLKGLDIEELSQLNFSKDFIDDSIQEVVREGGAILVCSRSSNLETARAQRTAKLLGRKLVAQHITFAVSTEEGLVRVSADSNWFTYHFDLDLNGKIVDRSVNLKIDDIKHEATMPPDTKLDDILFHQKGRWVKASKK